jgi:serine/threonine protein kinase
MIRIDDVGPPTTFLIDFGLARQFRNPATYLHTQHTKKHSVVGTLPFTSVNGQQGHAQSRRDDLESLTYTIIFLARGDLPWTTDSIRRNHEAILQKKISITAEELCEGLPPPFSKFVIYVRSLGFNEKPDYEYLHTVLLQCLQTDDLGKAPRSLKSSRLCRAAITPRHV